MPYSQCSVWAGRQIYPLYNTEKAKADSEHKSSQNLFLSLLCPPFFLVHSSPCRSCTSQPAIIWVLKEKEIQTYLKQELPGRGIDTGHSQRSSTNGRGEMTHRGKCRLSSHGPAKSSSNLIAHSQWAHLSAQTDNAPSPLSCCALEPQTQSLLPCRSFTACLHLQ